MEQTENLPKEFGKKVIFLYPQSVIQEKLVTHIIRYEYEVYLIHDHQKNLKFINKYNNAILFINIDDGLKEEEWEKYIRNIINNDHTKNVRIGILSYNDDKDLAKKYLMDVGVQCGFIRLKLGVKESTAIILKTLEVNEAKGQRKYVRVSCKEHNNASFNLKIEDDVYSGQVTDLSSVGMAITFNKPVELKVKSLLSDIQLRLKGIICMVTGVVIAIRKADKNTYVIMFVKNMHEDTKNKIYHYIYSVLQESIKDY